MASRDLTAERWERFDRTRRDKSYTEDDALDRDALRRRNARALFVQDYPVASIASLLEVDVKVVRRWLGGTISPD